MIEMELPSNQQTERPKRRFLNVVRKNTQIVGVREEETQDRKDRGGGFAVATP